MSAVQLFFILLAAGTALICIEVFVPGGIIGVIGALALIGAIVVSFFAFPPAMALLATVGVFILAGFAMLVWIVIFPNTRLGKQMTVAKDLSNAKIDLPEADKLTGKIGEAVTDLRPSGFAMIDGRKVDVISRGEMIKKGEKIKVISVQGNKLIVAKETKA